MSLQSQNSQSKDQFISCFYEFSPIIDLDATQTKIEEFAKSRGILGLVILASEGINCTFSAPSLVAREAFQSFICELFSNTKITFKHSNAKGTVFRRFKVKQRPEIVTLGVPELKPDKEKNRHLSPKEWNEVLKNEGDILMIDTRNWYETQLGKFKKAVAPDIDQFTDFPEYLEKNSVPKDKKILIYCTGGIRCEKGILQMERQGYDNVYQLDGGILNYLKEFPNDEYEGSCFVFDHRVAVDQNLEPVDDVKLCPHTGQPATTPVTCVRCDTKTLIAKEVAEDPLLSQTCSKNCAYHWKLNPGRKGQKQVITY